VPSNLPQKLEHREVSYQYLNLSDGKLAAEGSWANGPTPDGNGTFSYHDGPTISAPMPPPTNPDPRSYGTTPQNQCGREGQGDHPGPYRELTCRPELRSGWRFRACDSFGRGYVGGGPDRRQVAELPGHWGA
jgi:hypothetical protein